MLLSEDSNSPNGPNDSSQAVYTHRKTPFYNKKFDDTDVI